MGKIHIKQTQILTMTSEQLLSGDILIEHDRIVAMGQIDEQLTIGAQVIDGKNTVAMPGLINTHAHGPMSLLRSYADNMPLMPWLEEKIWPAEAKLTEEAVYWGTQLAILEMLQSGTTTFAEMYDHMLAVGQAVSDSGIRANLSRGVVIFNDEQLSKLEENVQLYRQFHQQAENRIRVWFSVHAPYTCLPQYIHKVVEKAQACHSGIHVHVAETLSEIEQIKRDYGKTPVAHLNDLGVFDVPALAAHCVHLTEQDMDILMQKQVGVAHNVVSNMKLASGIAPVSQLMARGINVALGTDGASSNNSINMFKEMTVCALVHKTATMDSTAMNAYDVLQMATVNGAKALHWQDEIGTLEVGKKADLILVDLDQPHFAPWNNVLADLVYSAQGSDVKTTIVNGKILMENRQFTALDKEKIMAEAKQAANLLCK